MKTLTLLIFTLICSSVLSLKERKSFVNHDESELPRKVKNPTPTESADKLPKNFFWNDVDGVNYLTLVRNHHIPNYCGGCYAFASTSVLSDRIKIARGAQWPDILISPQVVLSCTANRGCHGGSPAVVFEYVHNYGITDESCSSYRALGHENGAPCTDEIKCQVCDSKGDCRVPDSYPVYYVEEFGHIKGEKAMLNEVYHRGPIACSLDANYIETYTGGIFSEPTPKIEFNHVVEIVGFGEEDGVPYWLVKNSWGSFWGEQGFFRALRGKNTLGLESTCSWAVPKDTWTTQVRNYTNSTNKKESTGGFLDILGRGGKGCVKVDSQYERFYRTSKTGNVPAWTSIQVQDLPRSWDWRNVNGVNFVSWIKSQNSPRACAACWAEAATSALADRIMISRNTTFPEIALSVQAVINCQGGGDCNGGDPIGVYEFAYSHGIPEDSCQNYQGKNPDVFECSPIQICKNCDPPAPFKNGTDPAICQAIQKYDNWKVSDYGTISGIEDMKKAIWKEGPISCGIQTTKRFEEYTDGVFSQFLLTAGINHQVAIVGWDVGNDGVEYWIARNSWGSYWGELGFFRIQMGKNNLGIEKECIWGTPVLEEKQQELITV